MTTFQSRRTFLMKKLLELQMFPNSQRTLLKKLKQNDIIIV